VRSKADEKGLEIEKNRHILCKGLFASMLRAKTIAPPRGGGGGGVGGGGGGWGVGGVVSS